VKESPQEIGFVIGGSIGVICLWWLSRVIASDPTRSDGLSMYIFVMMCGGIGWCVGWGVGWLINHLFSCFVALSLHADRDRINPSKSRLGGFSKVSEKLAREKRGCIN
jgi:hypothetical protein